jgi:ribose-phosphate pyrophosphokinase
VAAASARVVRAISTPVLRTAVFCPGAFERIEESPIKEVVVTDTLNHDPGSLHRKVRAARLWRLVGEAVQRIHEERSLSSLFV